MKNSRIRDNLSIVPFDLPLGKDNEAEKVQKVNKIDHAI